MFTCPECGQRNPEDELLPEFDPTQPTRSGSWSTKAKLLGSIVLLIAVTAFAAAMNMNELVVWFLTGTTALVVLGASLLVAILSTITAIGQILAVDPDARFRVGAKAWARALLWMVLVGCLAATYFIVMYLAG